MLSVSFVSSWAVENAGLAFVSVKGFQKQYPEVLQSNEIRAKPCLSVKYV